MLVDGTVATSLSDRSAWPNGERIRSRVAADFGAIFGLDKCATPTQRRDVPDAVRRVALRRNESHHVSRWLLLAVLAVAGIVLHVFIRSPDAAQQQAVATPSGQSLTVADGGAVAVPWPLPARPAIPEVRGVAGRAVAPRREPPTPARPTAKRPEHPAGDVDSGRAASSLESCAGLEERHHALCMRPAVLRADDRLRAAYDHAVHAGVSRQLLIAHRSHWSRRRRKAARDPQAVIDGYDRIGQELRLEAGHLR